MHHPSNRWSATPTCRQIAAVQAYGAEQIAIDTPSCRQRGTSGGGSRRSGADPLSSKCIRTCGDPDHREARLAVAHPLSSSSSPVRPMTGASISKRRTRRELRDRALPDPFAPWVVHPALRHSPMPGDAPILCNACLIGKYSIDDPDLPFP